MAVCPSPSTLASPWRSGGFAPPCQPPHSERKTRDHHHGLSMVVPGKVTSVPRQDGAWFPFGKRPSPWQHAPPLCLCCGLPVPTLDALLCSACVQCGTVSQDTCDAIYRNVIHFFRHRLHLKFTSDMIEECRRQRGSATSNVWEVIPLRGLEITTPRFNDVYQLGRCHCTTTHRNGSQYRWVRQICVWRNLPREVFGAIVAHELMHAYIWLQHIPLACTAQEESICNDVMKAYLCAEADALRRAPYSPETRHRLRMCQYRLLKLEAR